MRLDLSSPDLYAALSIERDAHEDTIREYIGALYREALANAEHRDPAMRCYYAEMLQVVPRGYSIFLDPVKRAGYDAYLQACAEGYQESFEQFFSESGHSTDHNLRDREGLLLIRPPAPQNFAAAQNPASGVSNDLEHTTEYSGAEETAPERTAAPALQSLPFLAGFGCGLTVLVMARGALHWPLQNALILAVAVTVFVFIFFHFRLRFSS